MMATHVTKYRKCKPALRSKQNRAPYHMPHTEKGLMVCTPPGINSEQLSQFASIGDVRKFFDERTHKLQRDRQNIRGWSDKKFSNQLMWYKNIEACLRSHYKNSCESAEEDRQLTPFIKREAKRLMKIVGINPDSVSLLGNIPESGPLAIASAPSIEIGDYNDFCTVGPACLRFNLKKLKDKEHGFLVFLIAREIGHLLRNHGYEIEENPFVYNTRDQIPALKKLGYETDVLHNLEADVTVALLDKDVAHTIHEYLLRELSKPHTATTNPTNKKMVSEIEQTTNDLFLWIHRIVELHEKEKI